MIPERNDFSPRELLEDTMAKIEINAAELMAAVRGLSASRDLPQEVILEALRDALGSAYQRMPGSTAGNVSVDIGEASEGIKVFAHYAVMEAVHIQDPSTEIGVGEARTHDKDLTINDVLTIDVTPDDFGRIAAQTAKQVILQRIREAEREQTFSTYNEREGEIVYGLVQTANRDLVTVALDRVEAVLAEKPSNSWRTIHA